MLLFIISFCIAALLKPKSRILGHCVLACVIWPILTYFFLSGDVYYRIHDALAAEAFMKGNAFQDALWLAIFVVWAEVIGACVLAISSGISLGYCVKNEKPKKHRKFVPCPAWKLGSLEFAWSPAALSPVDLHKLLACLPSVPRKLPLNNML